MRLGFYEIIFMIPNMWLYKNKYIRIYYTYVTQTLKIPIVLFYFEFFSKIIFYIESSQLYIHT